LVSVSIELKTKTKINLWTIVEDVLKKTQNKRINTKMTNKKPWVRGKRGKLFSQSVK
jgi:hypothetical protein